MSARVQRRTTDRTALGSEQGPVLNVTLTLDERDAIDGGIGRVRTLVDIATRYLMNEDTPIRASSLPELLEVIEESLDQIKDTFAAADRRRLEERKRTS